MSQETGREIQTPISPTYTVFKAVQVRPVSGEGVMLCVRPASRGQRRDEDGLERDEDLAEGGLLHQPLQLLEVNAHAEGGAVTVHLNERHDQTHLYFIKQGIFPPLLG